jgi:hypothetical protein
MTGENRKNYFPAYVNKIKSFGECGKKKQSFELIIGK